MPDTMLSMNDPAITGRPSSATSADARLVGLGRALEAAARAAAAVPIGIADEDEILKPINRRQDDLEDQIIDTPAITSAGMLVKLRRHTVFATSDGEDFEGSDARILRSIYGDLERMAAAEEAQSTRVGDPIVTLADEMEKLAHRHQELTGDFKNPLLHRTTAAIQGLEHAIANMPAQTLVGGVAQLRVLCSLLCIVEAEGDQANHDQACKMAMGIMWSLTHLLERHTGTPRSRFGGGVWTQMAEDDPFAI